ncbi:DUF3320 domain-containing protein [Pseudomonas aeruginosa]|uniref:DUF3320 domain-containing protein n=1 Tax=Pseudomonas aeruginosa TaxID=287 RepID=UPI000EAD78E9|nr:DUF3320 domain-containing protein [Pseudomonas aeruginosa]HBO3146305.1 DUF3320 domain-containing protein [Pseudomonas aeruginosa]HCL4166299.1 DUF3320 domain-containing protein [Pseudomonas aeruginosa]
MVFPHKRSLGEWLLSDAVGEKIAVYSIAEPASVVEGIDPSAFFEKVYNETLMGVLRHIVEQEGPILESVLARRVARVHGWERTGERIRDRVSRLAGKSFRKTKEAVGCFYWPESLPDDASVVFRRPESINCYRTADEICLSELAALAGVLTSSGCGQDELVREMSSAIGLHRISTASRCRFEKAIAQSHSQVE